MPTYEFRCPNGHTFDEFHKISDAPSTAACPACGAAAERAISGGAGLVFKGSGFYLTDYGKNAHRSGSAPAKAEAKAGESSGGDSKGGDAKAAEPKGGATESAAAPAAKPAAPAGGNTSGGSTSGGGSASSGGNAA